MKGRFIGPLFFSRLAVACLIVVPPLVLYTRSQNAAERAARAEEATSILRQEASDLARERIDRSLADCATYNEQRIASITTVEALVRVAFTVDGLTPRTQLALIDFQQKARVQIERATKPKTCTIAALGLESLEGIVGQGP